MSTELQVLLHVYILTAVLELQSIHSTHTIHPWVTQVSNNMSPGDQTAAVVIPDVNPTALPQLGLFSVQYTQLPQLPPLPLTSLQGVCSTHNYLISVCSPLLDGYGVCKTNTTFIYL